MIKSLPFGIFNEIKIIFPNTKTAIAKFIVQSAIRPAFSGGVYAINAEKILRSLSDSELVGALRGALFCYPDGFFPVLLFRRKIAAKRIPGCELWLDVARQAEAFNVKVFLVGGKSDVLSRTVAKFKVDYPGLNIAGSECGYFKPADTDELIHKIAQSGAQIIFVAMGSPLQERFIGQALKKGVKGIFMGLGGSFDVYVGAVKRAPGILANHGLEWLYRLLAQPMRASRQIKLLALVKLYLRGKLRFSVGTLAITNDGIADTESHQSP